jgi:alkylation response protein AidB-like acyl-CoA dehydrogenase
MNPPDSTTLTLVRHTAKAFVERHGSSLAAVERQKTMLLPPDVLAECASLGWLGSLGNSPDDSQLDGSDPAAPDTDEAVLSALVFELGCVSPALGARLLSHHYARLWLEKAQSVPVEAERPFERRAVALDSETTSWFGVPVFVPHDETHSLTDVPLTLEHDELTGKLTMVVGGPETTTLLCLAKYAEQARALVSIPWASLTELTPVKTLGLQGLGIVDIKLTPQSNVPFTIVGVGPVVANAQACAYRSVLPAYAALCRAILTTCQNTATTHATSRHQGGGLLNRLPQILEKLSLIERSHWLSKQLEQTLLSDPLAPLSLLVALRQAVLQATDAGIQILGGAGYVVGSGQERLWRDARQVAALFGTNLGLVG